MEQFITWAGLAALLPIAGYVWRIADRNAKNEAAVEAAQKSANTATARVIALEKLLTEHRIEVAREYATNAALVRIETTLATSIDKLGDRIDAAFALRHK